MPTFHDQLRKAYFETLQADISTGSSGRFWLRTDTSPVALRFWNGSAVKEVVTTDDAQALTAKTRLEVVKGSANIATGYGLIRMSTVSTDNTAKESAISSGHYDSDDEDVCAVYVNADNSQNDVCIGGGVDKLNAVTRTRFFAAADRTTVTGTEVAQALVTGFRFILATTHVGLAATPSNPSSGEFKYYVKTDGYPYLLDSNGTERRIGTGSDSGINYVSNPDAEIGTTGWATYADAAGSSPVDGTGGAPTLTIARNTSSPLRGSGQFRITKDAANRQGEGVSYDFTIDSADKSRILTINFDYAVSSSFAAGTSSDVRVFVYDVTNSVLIQPAGHTISGGTGIPHRHTASFQAPSNSTSYRLIFHVATTNASAWTMDIDRVSVSPQDRVYGVPVTDWTSFTPTSAWSSNVTHTGFYRRVGDSAEIQVKIGATGGTTAASLTVNMPTGLVIDTTKLASTTGTQSSTLGTGVFDDASTGEVSLLVRYASTTTVSVVYLQVTSADDLISYNTFSNTSPATIANGDSVILNFRVPIVGWSSNVEISSSADTRVVAARYSTNTGATIGDSSDTIIDFEDLGQDTHGAVTTGASWKYTAQVPGFYSVKAMIQLSSGADWDDGDALSLNLYKNGSKVSTMGRQTLAAASAGIAMSCLGSDVVYLSAGDYVDVRANQNSGSSKTLNGTATDNYIAIHRLSGPAQVAASESIISRYSSSAGNSLTNGAETLIDFATKSFDSHSAVTTGASWKFTAPVAGKYKIKAAVLILGSADWEAGEEAYMVMFKNAVANSYLANYTHQVTANRNIGLVGDDIVSLNAGDYIDIRVFQNSDASCTLATDAKYNYVTVERVAN